MGAIDAHKIANQYGNCIKVWSRLTGAIKSSLSGAGYQRLFFKYALGTMPAFLNRLQHILKQKLPGK